MKSNNFKGYFNYYFMHLAVIMDGNRRYARRLGKPPWYGHRKGVEKVREFLSWVDECKRIKHVTLYTLSIENLKNRKKVELVNLFKILKEELLRVIRDKMHEVHEYGIKIRAIGRIYLLPRKIQVLIRKVEEITCSYKNYNLNFAIAYGGKQEIVDAARKLIKLGISAEKVNERVFERFLYTNGTPEVDILIRTGGEKRLSNFLIWQIAYAGLFFVDKYWPEFEKKDFLEILKEFERRERRFGR